MSKHSPKSKFVRVRAKDVAESIATADWKRIDRMKDRDIARANKGDLDTAELDHNRAFEVVLPETIDVCAIRHRLHLSQAAFARRIGVSTRLVSDWEQGRQRPAAAARALLVILDELGDVALRALARGAA